MVLLIFIFRIFMSQLKSLIPFLTISAVINQFALKSQI